MYHKWFNSVSGQRYTKFENGNGLLSLQGKTLGAIEVNPQFHVLQIFPEWDRRI